jgi:septum formation protein
MEEIILASASPRRSELLRQVGVSFKVYPPDVDEKLDPEIKADELVQSLAYKKAVNVAQKLKGSGGIIISADTVVVKDGILGKPSDEGEAFSMLKSLQGKWHSVITGLTVIDSRNFKHVSGSEKTRVKFRKLSDDEITSYIKTGEPMDKAGSYGIQGKGALLAEKIEGCYFNVVGLPLARLSLMLKEFGIDLL